MSADLQARLEQRLGKVHARQRLGMEQEHQHEVFSPQGKFFHLENWYSIHEWIRRCFKLSGLHGRAQRNARAVELRRHTFVLPHLPAAFNPLRILHLSDLHLDMDQGAVHALIEQIRRVNYDLCVLTGDYRARTFGSIDEAMQRLAAVRSQLTGPVYAVLGNHDSIRMVPAMEAMDITLLLNEHATFRRGDQTLWLAGIDDAHYFRVDNIEKAIGPCPEGELRILLSHTPEVYRQAAHAGFDIFLCGHTHGGQICLPGGIPLTLDARCPRHLGRGGWRHQQMQGYTSAGAGTSIVDLRLNCPPEITLHTLVQRL
jgi:predicted MPP superfamily phosphohydrolase